MFRQFLLSNVFFFTSFMSADLPEMIIGKESISPGIDLVFEGAIKDDVFPEKKFGSEKNSDIHIEVLANWNEDAPRGSPVDGFVAYLKINVEILNQTDSMRKKIELLPHLNLTDNLHYALNISLPGARDDLYTLIFTVEPPNDSAIGLHYDWREEVGPFLSQTYKFVYRDLDFTEIANSTRR